jgi:hypothetical protein
METIKVTGNETLNECTAGQSTDRTSNTKATTSNTKAKLRQVWQLLKVEDWCVICKGGNRSA